MINCQQFIDAACAEHVYNGHIERPATLEATLRHVTIYKQSYELIDTPGFDNPNLSNYEVFARIAEYLLSELVLANLDWVTYTC